MTPVEGYKSSGGAMIYNEELDMEIPVGWEVCSLSDFANFYSNRISLNKLDITNYISTENMLPERNGVCLSSGLPNSLTANKFEKGNVLISNIRPYFKKIWLAQFTGGCSNDILCLQIPERNIKYVFATISRDEFFEYVMKGAKGTKMPRGDKNWIMKYQILKPAEHLINKYKNAFSSILKQIKSNRQISNEMEHLSTFLLSKMATVED